MTKQMSRLKKKDKGNVQGVPQSQTAALLRHQEEEETDKPNKRKSNKRGNRNAKKTKKSKNEITQGKT